MLFLSLSLPNVDSTDMGRLPRLKTKGDDLCTYCGTTDCAGHTQEDAKSFGIGGTAGSMLLDWSADEGDESCPHCGDDCTGHPQEDGETVAVRKLSGSVSMDAPRDDGDDPCPYCGTSDCSGHDPEDAGSSWFESAPDLIS